MSWQPTQESLTQLAACLKDSLSGFDKNAQKRAELVSSSRTLPLTLFSRPPLLTGACLR